MGTVQKLELDLGRSRSLSHNQLQGPLELHTIKLFIPTSPKDCSQVHTSGVAGDNILPCSPLSFYLLRAPPGIWD